jgi:acrylyl-CoA reductase (NADPH)
VAAVTGKTTQHQYLRRLGAAKILGRNDVNDQTDRPLLTARWAAAVDTVGGNPLATLLRSTMHRACVTAVGLVAGAELSLTVYPFILRGVTLAGIDSAKCPRPQRLEMWEKLAGPWRVEHLDDMAETVTLNDLPKSVEAILAGESVGRTLVVPMSNVKSSN